MTALLMNEPAPSSKIGELGHTSVTNESEPARRKPIVPRRKPWLPPEFEGQVFNDRYRMGELLGVGGMALVYKAEHIEIQKPVAVKVLHPRYADDPKSAQRFLEEARAASRLRHDHIIDITDFGRTPEGYVYFVLEYLEGEDLETTANEDGPLQWQRVVRIAKQICKALALAHESGIIHRDIKPANCFRIARDNNADFVKVLDFGIATSILSTQSPASDRARKGEESTLDRMGTPAYMAPEILRGDGYDHRVDIYALGVLMYRLLTGKLPSRPSPTPRATGASAGHTPLRSSASLVQASPDNHIPEPIEAIIIHAMAHDPKLRFFDAQEFHDALERAEADLSEECAANLLARDPLRWRGQDPGHPTVASSVLHSVTSAQAAQTVRADPEVSQSYIVMPLSNADASSRLGLEGRSRDLLNPTLAALITMVVVVLVFLGARFYDSETEVVQPAAEAPALPPLPTYEAASSIETVRDVATATPQPAQGAGSDDAGEPAPQAASSSTSASSSSSSSSSSAHKNSHNKAARNTNSRSKVRSKLPRQEFAKVMRPAAKRVQSRCLQFLGGMQSTLTVTVDITPSGEVRELTIDSQAPRLFSCVQNALADLEFPRSPRGGTHRWNIRARNSARTPG